MYNKVLHILLCLLLGISLTKAQTKYEVVSSSSLNVRSLPSSEAQIIGTLRPGDIISVKDVRSGWAEFTYNGRTAYAASRFLLIRMDADKTEYEVTASKLNVRSLPSSDSQIIGSLSRGDVITIFGVENGWAQLRYNDRSAYVSLEYLTKCEPSVVDTSESLESETPSPECEKEPSVPVVEEEPKKKISALGIDFLANVMFGYSNFASSESSSIPMFYGFGAEADFRFYAKEKVKFIPKGSFAETSLGYVLKGSAAHPIHMIEWKLFPIGYTYELNSKVKLSAKLGMFLGIAMNGIQTEVQPYSFYPCSVDCGIILGAGAVWHNIYFGLSYERGFSNLCPYARFPIHNQAVFINVSYRFLRLK